MIMKTFRYFYHPDHLGSSSWITDGSGNAIQHLHYLPFGEDWVDQRNASWSAPYTFSGKEKDVETGYSYFGARYYDSGLSIWLSVDPMSDNTPFATPYAYCANNPVRFVDPTGMEWEDIDGKPIEDHSKIKVYIFYNPEDFDSQSKQMYKDAVAKYGEGSVAMSNVTTTAEFAQDWGDMASNDIQEVNINHHGGPQTLTLDAHVEKSKEYITATGTGKTPAGRPAMNVGDLPTPSGNVQNAQLNINSCKSNNTNANLKGSGLTLAQSFRNNTDFRSVRTTSQNVSYHNWFSPNRPHPQDHSNWQFLNRPTPLKYPGVGLPPK